MLGMALTENGLMVVVPDGDAGSDISCTGGSITLTDNESERLKLCRNSTAVTGEYITEHLPEQYQVCLSALDTILKHAFEILQRSDDNREELQAMELFKDTHLVKLELLSNATTIDSALNYIRSKQQEQQQQQKQWEQVQLEKGLAIDSTTSVTTTTNQVF
jgi:hypothetical protein